MKKGITLVEVLVVSALLGMLLVMVVTVGVLGKATHTYITAPCDICDIGNHTPKQRSYCDGLIRDLEFERLKKEQEDGQ